MDHLVLAVIVFFLLITPAGRWLAGCVMSLIVLCLVLYCLAVAGVGIYCLFNKPKAQPVAAVAAEATPSWTPPEALVRATPPPTPTPTPTPRPTPVVEAQPPKGGFLTDDELWEEAKKPGAVIHCDKWGRPLFVTFSKHKGAK